MLPAAQSRREVLLNPKRRRLHVPALLGRHGHCQRVVAIDDRKRSLGAPGDRSVPEALGAVEPEGCVAASCLGFEPVVPDDLGEGVVSADRNQCARL